MPIITVKILETTKEKKAVAAKEISLAAAKALNEPIEAVTIIFEETKKSNYARKGELLEK